MKQPTKSILKSMNTPSNTSWFSKFNEPNQNNNNNNTTTTSTATTITAAAAAAIAPTRKNKLFNSFRNNNKPVIQQSDHEQITLATELTAKELKRVRFPVSGIKREFLFLKDDPIIETKKQLEIEPINIQTLSQLLSLYELVCRNKQAQTIDLLVTTLIVSLLRVYIYHCTKYSHFISLNLKQLV